MPLRKLLNKEKMNMARQSQNAGILQALKEGAKITPMGALRRFGYFRLSVRIADIRKMGYKVKTRIVSRNRKNYAEYYLEA
jgi:hypothetical protein